MLLFECPGILYVTTPPPFPVPQKPQIHRHSPLLLLPPPPPNSSKLLQLHHHHYNSKFVRFRFTVLFIPGHLLVSNFIFMGSRFGSPVLVVKPKPNRTGKISGFSNWFNRFFILVWFSRLIFHQFFRFFRLLGYFEHPNPIS
jgi:hypothetical protein